MSLLPQKGDTVTVFVSSTGRLSLYPPSMTRIPLYLGGSHPEKMGMKADASITWDK